MRKKFIKGSSIGLAFTGAAYLSVKVLGFNSISLSILMYLYVLLSLGIFIGKELRNRGERVLPNIVLVSGGEDLEFRKPISGEKYRIRGDVEKL